MAASILELVKAAEAIRQSREAADPLYSGVKALNKGVTGGFDSTAGKSGLDTALKIVKLKQSLDKMKYESETRNVARDVLKANGYLPLDPDEQAAARKVANDNIGTESVDPAEGVKTNKGKITSIVNSFGGKDYDVELSGDITNPKLKYKKKTTSTKGSDKKRARDLAEKMAKEAFAQSVYTGIGGQKNVSYMDSMRIKDYRPTTEEIMKYLPTAENYLYGTPLPEEDTGTPAPVKTPGEKKSNTATVVKKTQPEMDLDGVGDIDTASIWDLINTK